MLPCSCHRTSEIPSDAYTGSPATLSSLPSGHPPSCALGSSPAEPPTELLSPLCPCPRSPLTAENTVQSLSQWHTVYLANLLPTFKSQKASPDFWALVGAPTMCTQYLGLHPNTLPRRHNHTFACTPH